VKTELLQAIEASGAVIAAKAPTVNNLIGFAIRRAKSHQDGRVVTPTLRVNDIFAVCYGMKSIAALYDTYVCPAL
jgi:hypothetical protein